MKLRREQDGFHVIELGIILVVVGVIIFAGLKVLSGRKKSNSASSSNGITWQYDQEKKVWLASGGSVPACPEPLKLAVTPVDLSQITAIGLPGSYRGNNYKAHGGLRAATSSRGILDVRLPIDAQLQGITRYYEAVPGYPDELQYLLDFVNDCGLAFRFDHIATLPPALQTLADKTPPPKKNDTSRNGDIEPIRLPMKAGEVVGTSVGFANAQNFGFDFGMYDYRQPNQISKNQQWANIHKQFSANDFHGICWLPMLPGDDAAKAEAIAKDRNNYDTNKPFTLTSDYCDFAPYKTLDFNNGQPTDG